MRLLFLGCLLAGFTILGCQDKVAEPVVKPLASTPAEKSFEQLRSGLFQIGAALDSIELALAEAKSSEASTADLKQSLDDIQLSVDSAGDALAEEASEEAAKSASPAETEARRKRLVDLANDALHDLRDARGIVDSLAGEKDLGPLEAVGLKIDVAMDDLRGALEALGGKEELEG